MAPRIDSQGNRPVIGSEPPSKKPQNKKRDNENLREDSREGNRNDINSIPREQVHEALADAHAIGSPVVELFINGQLVFFHVNDLKAWGYAADQSQPPMENGGNPREPNREQFLRRGSNPPTTPSGQGGAIRQGLLGGGLGGSGAPSQFNGLTQDPLWQSMFDTQMRESVYASKRQIKKGEQDSKVKMRMLLLMILMGNIEGVIRAMVYDSEKQNRVFNRLLVNQLQKVREAKSRVLKGMATRNPPRAHQRTNDPAGAARDQNAQMKYSQWVQVSTQLMNEIQNTERNILDLLAEGRRAINELTESLVRFSEAEARTTRSILTMRT